MKFFGCLNKEMGVKISKSFGWFKIWREISEKIHGKKITPKTVYPKNPNSSRKTCYGSICFSEIFVRYYISIKFWNFVTPMSPILREKNSLWEGVFSTFCIQKYAFYNTKAENKEKRIILFWTSHSISKNTWTNWS